MAESPKKLARLPELDLLRFLAALAVTLYHYVSSFPSPAETAHTALESMAAVTRYGYLGVDLFFMISGFVILWSSQNRTAMDFAISRAGRLYPSFWAAMLLTAACLASMPEMATAIHAPAPDSYTLMANATMLPGVLGAPMIDGVYWTLEIEIRFYAIVFALLMLGQMQRIELWLYVWLAFAIGCASFELPWIVKFVALDPYGPLFIAGCFFYLLLSRGPSASRYIGLALAGIACVALSIDQRQHFITPDERSAIVVPLIMVSFFAVFAVLAIRHGMRRGAALAYKLGALTYPLYLIHGTVGHLFFEALTPWFGVYVRILIISVAALLLAYAMSVTVETRCRKLFDTLLKKVAGAFDSGQRAAS